MKKEQLNEYINRRTGYRKKQETANFTDKFDSNSRRGGIAGKELCCNVDVKNERWKTFITSGLSFLCVNLQKSRLAAERGITLLALIITVVIMIILAAVTINVTLGDGGLIDQAKHAAEATVNSAQSEQEQLASLEQELANLLAEPEGPTQVEGVTIPDGFYYVGGTKAEGIVISDSPEDENKGTSHEAAQNMQGNQFVWIPVEDDSTFKTYEGYYDGELDSWLSSCSEPYANGYASEQSEYDAMVVNVLANNGFYVGRYEAGTTNSARSIDSGITDEVLVQQGKYVYNWVGWNDSETAAMDDETGGAVELSKNFAGQKGYTSVVSSLIYGVQWDAIMNFIDPAYATGSCAEDSFVRDSSGKGNYNGESGLPAVTGARANYAVKNIYDLGGNVMEWTMEAISVGTRAHRGGTCSLSGLEYPASLRGSLPPSEIVAGLGFRLVLYIK